MELVNEFRVPVPAEQAWNVLVDVERIAPCLPGTQLLSVDGDEFTGTVKVKVGPITVAYRGTASFVEKDATARRAVLKASGKETRGQGNAAAVVTAELKEDGADTLCVLTTDLMISGKAAQFGRGVLADVSAKLIGQFAERLKADVLADVLAGVLAGEVTAPAAAKFDAPTIDDAASVDLLAVLAGPLARRAAPVALGVLVGVLLGWLAGRRR